MKEPNTISDDLKDMFDSDTDRSGQQEGVKQMLSSKDISLKTEFNKSMGEADIFAGMTVLGEMLEIKELKTYIHHCELKRVSNDRKSREEVARMIQQIQPEPRRGILGNIFGGR